MNIIKDFKDYPGYYLNLIVMISCVCFSIYQIGNTKKVHDKEMEIFKASLEKSLSERINNDNVSVEKISDDIIIAIDYAVTKNYHEAKNASIMRENRYNKEKIGYSKYLNEDIGKIVKETHVLNKESQIKYLYDKTNNYVIKETPFLINKSIIKWWIYITIGYLVLVWVSCRGEKIDNVMRNESVLNIVDIGFYLALIQFTGGLNAHIWFNLAISMAIFVAILDLMRINKEINIRFPSGIWDAVIHKNFLTVFRSYSPIVLYIIVLMSGLIWATINHINYECGYWGMYLTLLIFLSLPALVLHFFIYTINLIINRNSK